MSAEKKFTAPSYANHSPLSWYREAATQAGFIQDPAQEMAIDALDQLWHQLMDFKAKRNRFLGRSWRSPVSPKGLYFWGGVGRGKSFLMDAFYGCLPYNRKKRVHFHAFMSDIHQRLNHLKNQENPMETLAKQIADEVRVLCFDEFHISHIADAMILGRLLDGLFAHGVVLVMTSNYAPDALYPNGLNRHNFLPTIDLIKQQLTVLNVDGGSDHRMRTLTNAEVYFPLNDNGEQQLSAIFDRITQGQNRLPESIEILGRTIVCKKQTDEAIWFDFEELFFTARSQEDYLRLAKKFRFIFISGIRPMTAAEQNEARRVTWFIDVLYDYRVKWCATISGSLNELYTHGSFANEFVRTVSRMQEMQSTEYLALPHLTLDKQ
ncbi:MAG: AFG1 family ATPase [Neisseriaceae bacterium]|nr:AFG1 family ATPase [Neisseriaceae bacterium]MBQ9725848.1 AFG1 family ATPase [Neisseriaceae bacterium]